MFVFFHKNSICYSVLLLIADFKLFLIYQKPKLMKALLKFIQTLHP